MRKTYTIEYLMEQPFCSKNWVPEQPINRKNWVPMTGFQYLQKSFAEGAFCMLKSFYGGNKKYRLIDSEGKVIAEWNTGQVENAALFAERNRYKVALQDIASASTGWARERAKMQLRKEAQP